MAPTKEALENSNVQPCFMGLDPLSAMHTGTVAPSDLDLAQEVSYLRERVDKLEGMLQNVCCELSNVRALGMCTNNIDIGKRLQSPSSASTIFTPGSRRSSISDTTDYMQITPRFEPAETMRMVVDVDDLDFIDIAEETRVHLDIAEEARVQRPHKFVDPCRCDFQDTFPCSSSGSAPTPGHPIDIWPFHNSVAAEIDEAQPRSIWYPWHQQSETWMATKQAEQTQLGQEPFCQEAQLLDYIESSAYDRSIVEANDPCEVCRERGDSEVGPDIGLDASPKLTGLQSSKFSM
jgi:hypothetical protein